MSTAVLSTLVGSGKFTCHISTRIDNIRLHLSILFNLAAVTSGATVTHFQTAKETPYYKQAMQNSFLSFSNCSYSFPCHWDSVNTVPSCTHGKENTEEE